MVLVTLSTASSRCTKSFLMNTIQKNHHPLIAALTTTNSNHLTTTTTKRRKRLFSTLLTPTTTKQQQQQQQQQLTIPIPIIANYPTNHHHNNHSNHVNKMQVRYHGGPQAAHDAATVSINFVSKDDFALIKTVTAKVGESLLVAARRNDVELEGACEGVCACSTCHVVLDDDAYDELEEPTEDEEDMLDMAFGLEETSRLGCQIIITKEMNDLKVQVPGVTRNFYVDGHVPQPH